MSSVFSMSPYLVTYSSAALLLLFIVSRVWFPKDFVPEHKILRYIYKIFQNIFLGSYFLFGIISLDASILWLFGFWEYTDWMFQLPSVILGLLIAPQFILRIGFEKPKLVDFLLGATVISIVVYIFHFNTPEPGSMIGSFINTLTICTVVVIVYRFLLEISGILSDKRKDHKILGKPLWDISDQLDRIYSFKINIILTIFVSLEASLKMIGSSLFIWI